MKENKTKYAITLMSVYGNHLTDLGVTTNDIYKIIGDVDAESNAEIIDYIYENVDSLASELVDDMMHYYIKDVSTALDRTIRKYDLTVEEYGLVGLVNKALELLIRADLIQACKESIQYASI